jgi:hypothetical protein
MAGSICGIARPRESGSAEWTLRNTALIIPTENNAQTF